MQGGMNVSTVREHLRIRKMHKDIKLGNILNRLKKSNIFNLEIS